MGVTISDTHQSPLLTRKGGGGGHEGKVNFVKRSGALLFEDDTRSKVNGPALRG